MKETDEAKKWIEELKTLESLEEEKARLDQFLGKVDYKYFLLHEDFFQFIDELQTYLRANESSLVTDRSLIKRIKGRFSYLQSQMEKEEQEVSENKTCLKEFNRWLNDVYQRQEKESERIRREPFMKRKRAGMIPTVILAIILIYVNAMFNFEWPIILGTSFIFLLMLLSTQIVQRSPIKMSDAEKKHWALVHSLNRGRGWGWGSRR